MGFVKLSHDLKEWRWINDKNTLYVYVRLLLDACWAETELYGVRLQRGQIVISQNEFAGKCGLSRQELRSALNHLTATNKITKQSTKRFSIITLVEYDEPTKASTAASCDSQPTINQPTLYKKEKKNIRTQETRANARESECSKEAAESSGCSKEPEGFESFWSAYPKKTAKQQALKAWQKLSPDEKLTAAILSSLERQKKCDQWTKDNGRYIPYPATWLNGRRWEDDMQTVKESQSSFDVGEVMEKILAQYKDPN